MALGVNGDQTNRFSRSRGRFGSGRRCLRRGGCDHCNELAPGEVGSAGRRSSRSCRIKGVALRPAPGASAHPPARANEQHLLAPTAVPARAADPDDDAAATGVWALASFDHEVYRLYDLSFAQMDVLAVAPSGRPPLAGRLDGPHPPTVPSGRTKDQCGVGSVAA